MHSKIMTVTVSQERNRETEPEVMVSKHFNTNDLLL